MKLWKRKFTNIYYKKWVKDLVILCTKILCSICLQQENVSSRINDGRCVYNRTGKLENSLLSSLTKYTKYWKKYVSDTMPSENRRYKRSTRLTGALDIKTFVAVVVFLFFCKQNIIHVSVSRHFSNCFVIILLHVIVRVGVTFGETFLSL